MISTDLIIALKHKVAKLEKENKQLIQICNTYIDVESQKLKQIKMLNDEIYSLQERILDLEACQ